MEVLIITIFVTILFSAFFSGMEIAFISANKLRLELDKQQNFVSARILSLFTQHPGQYIATMLVGNNIALVIYGIAFAKLLEPFFFRWVQTDSLVLLLQTISSTLLILVTAEFLPKTLFRINPNTFLRFFSIPLAFFYFLFYPVTKLTMGISSALLKVFFKSTYSKQVKKTVFNRVDLDHFVKEQNEDQALGEKEVENEVKLFRNALDFSKVKLREVMVPRTEMEVMDVNSSMDELIQKFIETGYSRILFYQDNIDNIIGYIHHSSIFSNPGSIRSNLNKVLIVPETMPASKLLSKFIQQHRSIAIVVDEFGGTSGMVTSEDILEEIFGEIEDEHDTIDFVERKLSENEYILSARIELDDLNEKYNLGFPVEENFETLAGFILFHHESIPKINAIIDIEHYRFKILKATNTKIELVNLKILDNT
ncbi:hemolysin family protein [Sunxiuqinia elliptica]|uniref:CBS domain containing-hemolysin-like protein n=1 Tax=Sunxiuqinia elliptica TaxID=655355 RepID=A0A4R6HBJ6_9BACT|nr:hemolysin family protein [Sunxiuqinia elliptica]TDO05045.1 CBS domain containing-hemolysin-like protein [Sunxiuqinia elliptica]TDO64594.1 CBS domain containing-hemolysin-like protein [Sunxiuqinia elliptica]